MLLSEIIYNIKNLISGGLSSDDEVLSDNQFAFIVNYYRARLTKNDVEKGRNIPSLSIQTLGRVPLIQADEDECCEIDSCVLRTKDKVPKPLETYTGINLTVSSSGLPYQQSTSNAIVWNCGAKYTKKEGKWYYQNGYIYIINPSSLMLDEITIKGLFEDPIEANKFRTCDCPSNNLPCNLGYDFEYPMPLHYVDIITKMFADAEYKVLFGILPDKENDSQSQTEQRG